MGCLCGIRSYFSVIVLLLALATLLPTSTHADVASPYRLPTNCEICKIMAIELTDRFEKSGRFKTKIELGHGIDARDKKSIDYLRSELRYQEVVHDPHICDEVIKYNVHAERDGSNRYAKGISETFNTIKGLVNKGVKVELGFPHSFLDEPDAEVTLMQKKCYQLVEESDELIEEWYWGDQKSPLSLAVCEAYLKGRRDDKSCLSEVWSGKKGEAERPEGPPGRKFAVKKKAKKSKKDEL